VGFFMAKHRAASPSLGLFESDGATYLLLNDDLLFFNNPPKRFS
jgi:hypothetical protein